jgi:hypothetical protein
MCQGILAKQRHKSNGINHMNMTTLKLTLIAAVLLLLPLAAQASTMSSPSYLSESGNTVSGSGNTASPSYSATPRTVDSAIAITPGTSCPAYTVAPAIPAKVAAIASTPTGDINGDGSVTIADALLALQISVGSVAQTSAHLKNGDVAPFVDSKPAPDGAITVADALMILRKVVALVNW